MLRKELYMKKIIFASILIGMFFTLGVTNKAISAQNKTKTTSSYSLATKTELDKLAMSMLKAAEKRNRKEMTTYYKEMMAKGATSVFVPQIRAKKTPQCPPIKMELNGRKLQGSLCAQTGYEYNGKEYWVGYCNK